MTADAPARVTVTEELTRTVVVEAGAGSGKTTAIVRRIVALVRAGTPIESIVAVTFTEAAAAELRGRVREELETVLEGDRPDAERAHAALTGLDDASITTLHGWARRIVAEFPLELGVPPDSDVLDEVQASITRARAWRGFLDELLADPALERSVAALDAASYRLWQLREAYEAMTDHLDRLEALAPPTDPLPITVDVEAVLAAIDSAVAFAPECRNPDDLLLADLRLLADDANRLRVARSDLDQLEILCEDGWKRSTRGKKDDWRNKAATVEAVAAVCDAVTTVRDRAIAAAVTNVTARVVRHLRTEAARRQRAGELEFSDLLVLARRLLRTTPAARRRLHERTATVIIDEFQDTDPIQIELAALVATDAPDVAQQPWWELPIPAGRLVVVGDPKQSIYRFRRADLRVFRRVLAVHEGSSVSFTANFRSRPGILAWVDACIGTQLAEGAARDADLQADALPLEATRTTSGDHPPVVVLGEEHDAPVHDARVGEADELAAVLREVADGKWMVTGDDANPRPARLGDVAVLLPTRVTLPYLEHALAAADIPMRIESQTLVLATDEVRDLLVILEAVVDPNDAIAVVAALRTPAFACRDDELAVHAIAGRGWDYLATDSGSSPASVHRGLETLNRLHGELALRTVDSAVEEVIRSSRLLELGLAHRRPRDHWRRVLHVADLARAFTEAGGTSLREFVDWLRTRADHDLRTVEVPVPEPDDDAVRVLTVHGAKGLEFPITILAGLNVADRDGAAPVVWRDGREPVLTGSRIRPADFGDLRVAEKLADQAEGVRLLYVASTRARDHLIVSVHRPGRGTSAAHRVAERCAAVPELWRTWQPAAPTPREATPAPAPFDLSAWQRDHDATIAHGSAIAAVAATGLAQVDEPEPSEEAPPARRGRAGTAIGRAVHATLQSIDLATGAGIDAAVRAQALAEAIPEHEAEIRELASAALRSSIVRTAVAGERFWREVPVGAQIGDVVLEGFIDLLVDSPDGLVVVDYKTDHLELHELDDRMEHYRIQGAAYALALETTLSVPVARCVFVFARTPEPVEREVTDLAAAVDEARARMTAVGSSG